MSPYAHNYAAIASKMSKGCPAVEAKRLGAYWTTTIGVRKYLSSNPIRTCRRTPTMPSRKAMRPYPMRTSGNKSSQEVHPKLVITTGTAGGIGKQCEVGDVVVSQIVRFDCQSG